MQFKKYHKIRRLGAEEVEDILLGKCYIQEKLDGANTSIWMVDGELHMGTRTREITEGFNGFCDYVREHENIRKCLEDNPGWRLYGEWLVRHSLCYNETAYKKFYLFDIEVDGKLMGPPTEVEEVAKKYKIDHPPTYAVIDNPTQEQLQEYVGKSQFGEKGEGIVIKNPEFVNRFGDQNYAKLVTQEFMEENALVFGGNNKKSETYIEQYFTNEYVTVARVKKIMNKLQPEIDQKLDERHTARIIGTVWHDIITEHCWDIVKKLKNRDINFHQFGVLAGRKTARTYLDIINNITRVTHEESNTAEGPTG